MSIVSRRTFLTAATSISVAGLPTIGRAQAAWPREVVKLAVPFSAGSMTDILARAIAEKLRVSWGQQVLVENRPGLGGVVGVAKGPADGHTLMLTSNGHTVVGVVNKNAGVDPVKDFVAVAKVASMPSILIAPVDGPVKSVKDLIAAAKANPGKLNYASAGLGSATGIAAELFKQVSGTQMALVAHRGMPEAQTSVLRGDSACGFTFFNVGGDLVQAGKLRGLAVTGSKRMAQLPDVPTFAEAGLPDFNYDAWFGIVAPAATPKDVVDKVNADVNAALAAVDLKALFSPQGVDLQAASVAAFDALIRSDTERYAKALAGAG